MKSRDMSLYTQFGDLLFNYTSIDSKYTKLGPNDCWPWHGPTHRQGYAMCGLVDLAEKKRKMTVVHRPLMMRKLDRALAAGEMVIHTCSNVKCCNPAHLILGDHKTKSEVMYANGRSNNIGHNKQGGVITKQNRAYKYSEDELRWMRTADSRDIAAKYNVTRAKAAQLRWNANRGFKWLKG